MRCGESRSPRSSERIADIHAQAAAFGRRPRISLSVRPIIAPTEAQAWSAHTASSRASWRRAGRSWARAPGIRPQAVGARRLVDFARESEVHDKRLWTPIAAAMGGAGNTTALVGTPEQVAESLLDYYDIGCTTLLIRGFDPLNDALEYGRELIPLVRAEAARRDRDAGVRA